MPIDRVVSKQVISSNPYLKGKTVGDTLSFLNSKAGTGVVSLAQGGIVSLKGGSKDPVETDEEGYYLPPTEAAESEFGRDMQLMSTRQKNDMLELRKKIKGVGSGITGYFGSSEPGASVEPQLRTPLQTPAPAANIPPTDTNAPGVGATPPTGLTTPAAAPVDPFAASQSRLDKYLSNLDSQRKEDRGISAILGGLTTAGTAGPLSTAIKQGAQTGIGYLGDTQKGYNAAMAQGLGAQAALDRNRVYSEMYGSKGQRDLDTKYSGLLQKYNATINKEIADNPLLKISATKAAEHRKKRLGEMTSEDPGFLEWFTSKGGSLGPQSIQLDTVPGGNVVGAIKPK
jgi:hypothetical protein